MFGFGKDKKRTPAEQAAKVHADLEKIGKLKGAKPAAKLQDDSSRHLRQLVGMLSGGEGKPSEDDIARACCAQDLPALMAVHVGALEFEARKDASEVFTAVLRAEGGGASEYIEARAELVPSLMSAYAAAGNTPGGATGTGGAAALHRGSMLRECARRSAGTTQFLAGGDGAPILQLFKPVRSETFDYASDAFETLRCALLSHRDQAAEFVLEAYDAFFGEFHGLLECDNYVTKRQGLKLLADMLLDEAFIRVMMRYIGEPANLIRVMTLLRDKSRSISYEAFHVFKIFVANPSKPRAVTQLLAQNKAKLGAFLDGFQNDREDEAFADEKALLKTTIAALQERSPSPVPPAAPQ